MTYREKLAIEHPEGLDDQYEGGCSGCPQDYGYEDFSICGGNGCDDCWSREIEKEEMADMEDKPLVENILNFGQGDDDCVFDAFQGICYLLKGYYALINYGEEWWEDTLNQDIWCDEMIKEAWDSVDWDIFEEAINKISKIMIGSYVNEYKFYKALEELNELGIGFRPQRKEKEQENDD